MDGPKVVVTLVCTYADEDEVDDIVDGLRALGRKAKLVAGLEQRPRLMADAVEGCGEWGLVVLCSSPRLGEEQRRKAEGMFGARKGPNHAMVRVDLGLGVSESVAAIERAYEGFVSSQGRIRRRTQSENNPVMRELVPSAGDTSATGPAVRLEPGTALDGDTDRIPLSSVPKPKAGSKERALGRERGGSPKGRLETSRREPGRSRAAKERDEQRLDRMMIMIIIGAGLLAVLAALSFAR